MAFQQTVKVSLGLFVTIAGLFGTQLYWRPGLITAEELNMVDSGKFAYSNPASEGISVQEVLVNDAIAHSLENMTSEEKQSTASIMQDDESSEPCSDQVPQAVANYNSTISTTPRTTPLHTNISDIFAVLRNCTASLLRLANDISLEQLERLCTAVFLLHWVVTFLYRRIVGASRVLANSITQLEQSWHAFKASQPPTASERKRLLPLYRRLSRIWAEMDGLSPTSQWLGTAIPSPQQGGLEFDVTALIGSDEPRAMCSTTTARLRLVFDCPDTADGIVDTPTTTATFVVTALPHASDFELGELAGRVRLALAAAASPQCPLQFSVSLEAPATADTKRLVVRVELARAELGGLLKQLVALELHHLELDLELAPSLLEAPSSSDAFAYIAVRGSAGPRLREFLRTAAWQGHSFVAALPSAVSAHVRYADFGEALTEISKSCGLDVNSVLAMANVRSLVDGPLHHALFSAKAAALDTRPHGLPAVPAGYGIVSLWELYDYARNLLCGVHRVDLQCGGLRVAVALENFGLFAMLPDLTAASPSAPSL